ncbi:MAG: MATE family efflux transporter [Ignisphaera sp.]|nr:MATE family efflux transporter [Ignisphaera sp.]MCX8168400.1 MATE family efflux transporter [Ignisphaera sp.]MDW8086103.1 MATE family efflux transporter [Ignisphaera sp.]
MKRADDGLITKYRDKILHGSLYRVLIWLGLPIVLVQLVNISYNLADAFWLSQYSTVTLAVPRQVWPTFMLFQALAMALSAANQTLISQYVGAKMYNEAARVIRQYLTVSTSFGAILGISYYLLRPLVFSSITTVPQEIYNDVLSYSAIITVDLTASYFGLCFTTILQSIGDTKSPAVVNGVSALINIVLDPFMILGIGPFPRMGVVGAAIATVIARISGGAILVHIVLKRFSFLRIAFTSAIDAFWVKSMIRIGLPILLMNVLNSTAFMFQLRLINLFGIVASTAWGIGFTTIDLADAVMWGLTQATAIVIGQCLGAQSTDRAKLTAKASNTIVGLSLTVGGAVTYLIRGAIISLFLSNDNPLSMSIYIETERFLTWALGTLPFFGLFFVGMSVGRGSGHTLYPTVIGIVRLWIIRIGLGYLLSLYIGSSGVWMAFGLSNIFSGIASLIWVNRGGWAKPVIKR